MRNVNGMTRVGMFLVVGVLVMARPAQGTFHDWEIKEVYTNVDGTIQFIELFTTSTLQQFTTGKEIKSINDDTGDVKVFTFGGLTPAPTADHHLLLATKGFADLAGVVTPDFILDDGSLFDPNEGFLFDPNGTVNFVGADIVSYTNIPTDGVMSLNFSFDIIPVVTSESNTPTNYAGDEGHIEVCAFSLAGDYNYDCRDDNLDFVILASKWMIDFGLADLIILAEHWLKDCEIDPGDPACVQ